MELLLGQVLHHIQLRTMERRTMSNTTMVTATTVANNRIGHGDIWSVFLSFHLGVISGFHKVNRAGMRIEVIEKKAGLLTMWGNVQSIA